jgi:phospholipid/cholesterol/gamma-HCH transport system substrate-binding protein
MAENLSEVVAGGAVLAAALGFLVYAGQTTGLTRNPDSYTLTASFRSVDGVTVGTDVRLAGVKVGTVTSLNLNPQTFFADATITLRNDVLLPDDSTALVSSEGLLGGSFVELQPGGSLDNLGPGDEIEDTQGAVSVISLLLQFVGGSGGEDAPAPVE